MCDPIEIPVDGRWSRIPIGNVLITDAIAAEILRRGLEHSRHGLPITPQTITMPPTKPPANQCHGEDAAGQYLYNLMTQKLALGHDTADRAADAIISAIRRGEVPGITTADQHLEPWKEVAELRAKLAQLEKDKADAANAVDGLVRDLADMKQQLDRSMLAAGEMLKRECAEHSATKGALGSMKEKYDTEFEAWAEANRALDGMKERAEAAEAAAAYHLSLSGNLSRRGITLQEQRDAAVAEVAALKARKVKLPDRKPNEGYTRQGAINDTYNSALLDCEDAIRAAGVEVA